MEIVNILLFATMALLFLTADGAAGGKASTNTQPVLESQMPSGFYQAPVNGDGHVCDTLHHLNYFDLTVLNCYEGQKAMITAKGQDWVETMSKADLLAPYGSRVLYPKGEKFLIADKCYHLVQTPESESYGFFKRLRSRLGPVPKKSFPGLVLCEDRQGSEVTACLWPTGDRVMMCTHSFTLGKCSQEPRPEVEATPEPLRRVDQCEERPSSLKRKTIAKVPGKNSSAKRLKVAHESFKPAAAAQSSNSITDGFYVVRASAAFCHVNIVTDKQSGNIHGFVRLNNGTSKDIILSGFEWVEDHRVQEICPKGPKKLKLIFLDENDHSKYHSTLEKTSR
ncbi:hypothetical protein FOZ63_024876 [Perkinsus olseni]|uniref:Uncharacterized protein n=1 Tax=Perkinsus olseni TaxID=32597 RepID=A0A7J6SR75_PEROL|nr:hypothetical protein FOZ63_024876 [Perkinsus olseni]KAF4735227.1 hypothetical protein FOZ62_014092 [Perkinsus olseni]